ncbi:hypothetical protein BC834DRAFT_785227, partial [Gloeopeniophorella convolvens]
LTIWQQNVVKSPTCQHDLISSATLMHDNININIIALQEPAINFKNQTIASRDWTPIYPMMHEKNPEQTRLLLLVRATLLTNNWQQIEFQSGDVTAIKIQGEWGTLYLFNIYNDCEHD